MNFEKSTNSFDTKNKKKLKKLPNCLYNFFTSLLITFQLNIAKKLSTNVHKE